MAKITRPGHGEVRPELNLQLIQVCAKSALFNAIRAGRIIEHAADSVDLDRQTRKAILRALKPFIGVRDANEHAHDVAGRKVQIEIAHHPEIGVSLDQISMVVLDPDKILMGDVNIVELYTLFRTILDQSRKKAGLEEWVPVA